MPKPAAYAITWDSSTNCYQMRDPDHAKTLVALFGSALMFVPDSAEWFDWLTPLFSFAFIGKSGRFTARRESKQRGETYWIAYQRAGGKLRKKYLGKTQELTIAKLEEVAQTLAAQMSGACSERTAPAQCEWETSCDQAHDPLICPAAWRTISERFLQFDLGPDPKGPPYDETPWILDRSHFPEAPVTKRRCPIHPTARWLLTDPTGQAWCTNPTCWRRYHLLCLGGLLDYCSLPGYEQDTRTRIEPGTLAWTHYTCIRDDEHVAFALRQALQLCDERGLPLLDLSNDARLYAPVHDG